jgi:hypothetical protein
MLAPRFEGRAKWRGNRISCFTGRHGSGLEAHQSPALQFGAVPHLGLGAATAPGEFPTPQPAGGRGGAWTTVKMRTPPGHAATPGPATTGAPPVVAARPSPDTHQQHSEYFCNSCILHL